jgi:protein-S-isoprenylcysteine O-methyltransferase Ste14
MFGRRLLPRAGFLPFLRGHGAPWVGLVFVLVAPVTLRKNYSSTLVIRRDHELVTSGIYRIVRHPIYFGAILVALGLPIGTASWIALPPMLLLISLVLYRMGIEERRFRAESPNGRQPARCPLIRFPIHSDVLPPLSMD